MKTEHAREKNAMSEAARAARNAYKRQWATRNRDKVRAAAQRYWEKKARIAAAGDNQ